MPSATGTLILVLVIAAFIGLGIFVRIRSRNRAWDATVEPPQDDARESLVEKPEWGACCEELDRETHQLILLLGRLEADVDSSESSDDPLQVATVDDTTVVDLEGVESSADDVVRLNDQRMADLQAALSTEAKCPDWEQESPAMVSIIEDLDDICEPDLPGPIEPDDLKKIRGIGKVLEGVLNEKGIHTFEQLATLSLDDIESISKELKHFGDRVGRDRWIEQAQELAESKAG